MQAQLLSPASAPAYGASAPPPPSSAVDHLDHPVARYRFDDLVARKEVRPDMADDLYGALTTSKVVLLLDDSGSMGARVPDAMSLPY